MAELLTNVAVQDQYSNAVTLGPALDIQQLVFQVFNEPVYAQFFALQADEGRMAPTLDPVEHYFPVGTLLSVDQCGGVRFRNAIPGSPATINAEIAFVGDPLFDFQSSGLFSAAVLTLSFLHNNVLVAGESVLDFEDTAGELAWSIVDTPGTKVAASLSFTNPAGFPGNVTTPGDFIAGTSPLAVGGGPGAQLHSTGTHAAGTSAATGAVFTSTVAGDTVDFRFKLLVTGEMRWAQNGSAFDVSLLRSSVGNLTLGGSSGGLFAGSSVVAAMGGDGGSPLYNAIGAATGAAINSGGVVQASRASGSANPCFTVTNPGATTDWRFAIESEGTMKWAAANTANDTTLARTAAGVLSLGGTGGGNLFTAGTVTTINSTGNFNVNAAIEFQAAISTGLIANITITVVNPTNPPTTSQTATLVLKFRNTSGAFVVTLSWGAAYRSTGSVTLPGSVPVSTQTVLQFQWDPDQSVWQLMTKIQ